MRVYLLAGLVMIASAGMAQAGSVPASKTDWCGNPAEKFSVSKAPANAPVLTVEKGKALVYFIQDDRRFLSVPRPIVRDGMDGSWLGATGKGTYFVVSVTPGEHHLCSDWQNRALLHEESPKSSLHFTAEAGKVYFFRTEDTWLRVGDPGELRLEAVDSDEGEMLIARSLMSRSTPRK